MGEVPPFCIFIAAQPGFHFDNHSVPMSRTLLLPAQPFHVVVMRLLLPGLFMVSSMLHAQDPMPVVRQYLGNRLELFNITKADVADLEVTASHTSRQSGVTHIYLRQRHQGIPVENGVANAAIRDGKVIHFGSRLVSGLSTKARSHTPALTPAEGLAATARQLGLPAPRDWNLVAAVSPTSFVYAASGISQKEIPVQLTYYAVRPDDIRLVWDITIYTTDGIHWWSLKTDAQSGEIVAQHDMVVTCNFDDSPFARTEGTHRHTENGVEELIESTSTGAGQYLVVPLPAESPNHSGFGFVPDPSDPVASPYGWHDIDGVEGADFTTTQGNNVHAYEDRDDDNQPGFSPDGGPDLLFDFPYDPLIDPTLYESAAITNLFYTNNMMHDIWYQYGFDEVSGNFQANNYQLGGVEGDYVQAEAQDGGGLNNANFGTPSDGNAPRMQMYLWRNTAPGDFLVINSPDSIAGTYVSSAASFGAPLPDLPITADLVLVEDLETPGHYGCGQIVNADQIAGRIAVVDRGNCTFPVKVQALQDSGAIAVIVVNNIPGPSTTMSGSSMSITIPSIMVPQATGDSIKAYLALGPVNASISDGDGVFTSTLDGDFDNGIIAHEYGHGISTRLVGGPDNVACLRNAEQMGEGWSDWFGLMITLESGDQGGDNRGIGTFAIDQPTDGRGIRPAPYSTDMSVNGYTYAASNDVNNISQPHGVGFIWATMLWDLTWALIDAYGGVPDPDFHAGTGGNNIAMQLVIEALKLTPCGPGMVDGRDAILEADRVLYDGAHECLIWEVFARRGLGFSADQGSPDNRTDQVEAFDLPTICQTAVEPPVAAFAVDTLILCKKTVAFTDESTSIPQGWAWDFGDGQASDERNPVHTYALGGIYQVKLVVTNTIGQDSVIRQVEIRLPPAPLAGADQEACLGDSLVLTAEGTARLVWRDTAHAVIHMGDTLMLGPVMADALYLVENQEGELSQFVGPADGSFGGGGYHGSGYFGATNFTAEKEFNIVSAWVDAPNGAERTFFLGRGSNFDGEPPVGDAIVDQVTVFVPEGQGRIPLDLQVPEAGDYYIGASLSAATRLYRNNNGPSYPYELPGFMTMTSSSANTDPTGFYYYLYDLEVREGDLCISDPDTVRVTAVRSSFTFVEDGSLTISFFDESTGARNWHWDFGDGNTSEEKDPIHTYDQEGDYTITLTINDGLCSSSETYTLLVSGIGDLRPIALTLQPNPANSLATLQLTEPISEDLDILIKDLGGKAVASYVLPNGGRSLDIDVSTLPAAMYLVQLTGPSYAAVRKLVVE